MKRRTLWFVLAFSIGVRVLAALYLGDQVVALPGTHDQISYDALAQNVAAGKGFVFDQAWYPFTPANTPTAHWSFLYSLYLAGVYAVFGHHPLVARLVQAVVVGALMPWLVYRLGKRVGGRVVGLTAAAAISAYIYLIYYSATLMTEPFYIVTLLWILDDLHRIAKSANRRAQWMRRWAELGVALGVATLLRQQALLLFPVLMIWVVWATWGRVRLSQLVFSVALALAIVAAFVLPWTVRNYRVYGGFLPLNSNVGWALFAANHPQQGDRFEPLNLPSIPAEWRGLNEAEINDRLTRAGIQFVLDEPGRFARQTLDRFRNYFRFWPERSSSTIANVSRVLSFGLYLPFMLYGLFLSVRKLGGKGQNGREMRAPGLLYLYLVAYAGMHLLTWAMHRYRLPVDAVLMVFVGLAWVDLSNRMFGRPLLVQEGNTRYAEN